MGLFDKVTEMSWLHPGIDESRHSYRFSISPDKRVALVVFLAVVTSVFFLFVMAYTERMELGDWDPVTEPAVLWINTALLVLASMAMQAARNAAAAGRAPRNMLLASGLMVAGFLLGQLAAWQALAGQGYYTMANPAYAFFYLLTAIHGLHLLGGLYVWARAARRAARGAQPQDLRLTLELCAIYWHYLLLVWVVLFILMLNT